LKIKNLKIYLSLPEKNETRRSHWFHCVFFIELLLFLSRLDFDMGNLRSFSVRVFLTPMSELGRMFFLDTMYGENVFFYFCVAKIKNLEFGIP
jgi:hypothetical protein